MAEEEKTSGKKEQKTEEKPLIARPNTTSSLKTFNRADKKTGNKK